MVRPLRGSERPWRQGHLSNLLCSALELVLVFLIEVLDTIDVFNSAPGGAGRPSHGVVQGFHELIFSGASLLRGREACRHSASAASCGHGGQRDQLHCFRIQRTLRIVETGKFLHGSHCTLLSLGLVRCSDGAGLIILDKASVATMCPHTRTIPHGARSVRSSPTSTSTSFSPSVR